MKDIINRELRDSMRMIQAMIEEETLLATLAEVARKALAVYRAGGKLLFAGNGGSAADAQHFAGEMVNRFRFDRPALAAIALSTDTSVLTAIGNDSGYEFVFSRQIEANGRRGDLFMGISTSGQARNVINAMKTCRTMGIATVGMTGRSGGAMAEHCDLCLRAPSDETPRIQEAHALLGHILCGIIERELFGT